MNLNKTIDSVLSKNPYIGWNNLSRAVFKELKEKYNLNQIEGRKGNYFLLNGKPHAFAVTTKKGKSECRQYYKDIEGLFCYNEVDNQLHYFNDIMVTKCGRNLGNEVRKAQTALMNNTKHSRISIRKFNKILKEGRCIEN
jgi:hypothetical protein